MCGIAGFIGEDEGRIKRMIGALSHRGPDGLFSATTHGASLGHARLAILDPSPNGNQPMWNDDHTVVIVYNGELFNYQTLKREEGFACKTGTDTEVILKLYDKYGMKFLRRMRGMYAFGLYDTKTKTLHVARDRSGIKPLYLAYPGGKLHFASEMRSLMSALPEKPALNYTSLSHFLRLQYVPGPETMCEGITSLPPATLLHWHDGKETREAIGTDVEEIEYHNREEFSSCFPEIMDEVVKEHLVSDRPVGIFLSGGMDSSIVLHHMCQHAKKPVRTYTVRFEATEEEGQKRFNTDADLAKLTAEHYGTEHQEVLLTAQIYRDIYRDTARSLDQPNADAVAPAQFLLSSIAKKNVDVVLNGSGGDELFGGYPRYRIARILESARFIPPALRSLAGSLTGYPGDVLGLSPGPVLAERLLTRPADEWTSVIKGNWFYPDATTQLFVERWKLETRNQKPETLRSFMEFDRHLWLVDESLRLADATTMGHGLEGRVPFLDDRVIAAAHGTKAEWNVTHRKTKALLKDTYRNILPDHLFTLHKASFYPPLAKWLRREAAALMEETFEHPRMQELFDMAAVRKLFAQHKAHQQYHLHTLSSLIQLRCWFETVYDA